MTVAPGIDPARFLEEHLAQAGPDLLRSMLTRSQLDEAAKLIDANEPTTDVARNLGMSRATLHRRLRGLES